MSVEECTTKRCTKCGKTKSLDEFHRYWKGKHGRDASCKQCKAEYRHRYYQDNREKELERNLVWLANNPDYHQHYYRANREKKLEQGRRWRCANLDKKRVHWGRYYARKNSLPSTLTDAGWEQILATYNYACAYCGRAWYELSGRLQQEHIIPVSQGGSYAPENIVPALPVMQYP